jgi:hypothetical protein
MMGCLGDELQWLKDLSAHDRSRLGEERELPPWSFFCLRQASVKDCHGMRQIQVCSS